MQIDNKDKAGKIKLIYLIFPFVLVIGTALFFLLSEKVDFWYIGFPLVLLVSYFIIMGLFKYNYVSYYAGPDKIRIRYKSLSPFKSPNKSIQIKSSTLHSFEVLRSKKGAAKKLVIYQNSQSGLAKYPSISLTAVDESDVEKISKSLQLILAMNKANQKQS